MRDDGRAAVQAHQSKPPRQPLAKKQVVAVVQDRLGDPIAAAVLRFPRNAGRKAVLAGFPWRLLHVCAVGALL